MKLILLALLGTAALAAQCDESSGSCPFVDDEISLMQLNQQVARAAERLLGNASAAPKLKRHDMISVEEAALKLSDFMMVDKGFESISDSDRTETKCRERLAAEDCKLSAHADILCVEGARLDRSAGAKAAYVAVLKKWSDCFKGTPVDKLNVYLLLLDELTVGFGNRAGHNVELQEHQMGAWGATRELQAMFKSVDDGIKPILTAWSADTKTAGEWTADPTGFWSAGVQKPGEFPQMYMNVIVQGMRQLGMDDDEDIAKVPVQYHGYRLKKQHTTPESHHNWVSHDPVETAITHSFGEGKLPAVTVTSGSRWDAWMHNDFSYNSAEVAIMAADATAAAHLDICYGHQAYAEHHDGKVAMHTWEVGARSSYVAEKYQPFFGGRKDLDISYVHFDEVAKPGTGGDEFIGNPHTKYQGMVYPDAITTQGHPEVPLIVDIAMIGSCTLWPFFYSVPSNGEDHVHPEGYCKSAYELCSGGQFVHEDVAEIHKCLSVTQNDGWLGKDTMADGQHKSDDPDVENGEPVPYKGLGDNESPQIEIVTAAHTFERACTQCYGAVQWNQNYLLADNVDKSAKCEDGNYGKMIASRIKLAHANSAGLDQAAEELHLSLCGDELEAEVKSLFKSSCDMYTDLMEKTKDWNTVRDKDGDLFYPSPEDKKTPISNDHPFHKVNVLTWTMADQMLKKDKACFTDTLADILPDARLIAELWVRDIVTANLGASFATCATFDKQCPEGTLKRGDETPCVTIGDGCNEDECCRQNIVKANARVGHKMKNGNRVQPVPKAHAKMQRSSSAPPRLSQPKAVAPKPKKQ